MPNLPRLDLVHKAIMAGIGNIEWHDSAIRVFSDNPEYKGFTAQGVRLDVVEFVRNGGKFEKRDQGGEHWLNEDPDNPYWYMAIIPTPEFADGLFVKVIILDYDEEEPFVQIVSCHKEVRI